MGSSLLASRRVFLTGATSGIGAAVRRSLLAEDATVLAASRRALELADQEGLVRLKLDVRDLVSSPQAVKSLVSECSGVDALVLCHGVGRFGSLEEFSPAQISELMNVDFVSHAVLCRALLPALREKAREGVPSHLVFLGSEAALEGARYGSIYCAAKFALRGFAQSLRAELAGSGVRVTLVNPGMVRTPFFDELSFEPGDQPNQALEPEDVAQAVLLALSARQGASFDEINLSPQTHVLRKKSPSGQA